mmetsp:Transcript_87985/g.247237  ORF Transcript_87985/g.247237 Transcript_87985/m.247237 type:complete len:381 (-) Transcript_87985:7-1149(-)
MPKKRVGQKDSQRAAHRTSSATIGARTCLTAGVVVLAAAVLGWWKWGSHSSLPAPEAASTEQAKAPAGIGPNVMAGQSALIERLTELLLEVEAVRGEEHRKERLAASTRVEAELARIEASVDPSTAAGKQHLGLIALCRSALESDRGGGGVSEEAWNDEELRRTHGVVTYASQAYWEEAYSSRQYGESYDWYGSWERDDLNGRSLGELLRPVLATDSQILVLGCGNSNMSASMYREGYRHITNVDVSEAVVEQMRERYGRMEGMTWQTMDASALEFPDASFDAVIEKGLFDALYAGTGTLVQSVLDQAKRVLRPGGLLLSVSFDHDRVERLFAPRSSPEALPEAPAPAPLECRVVGSLSYDRGGGDGSSTTTHVYACSSQ